MYNIDFDHIVNLLLPTFLRKDKMLAFLRVLVSPVKSLYVTFYDYRTKILDQLSWTGQVIYLQKLLNDKFQGGGLIYIIDGAFAALFYLSNKSEGYPAVYLQNKSEAGDIQYLINLEEYANEYDFIVKVPMALYNVIDINEMKALINMYKLASKYYKIESYE